MSRCRSPAAVRRRWSSARSPRRLPPGAPGPLRRRALEPDGLPSPRRNAPQPGVAAAGARARCPLAARRGQRTRQRFRRTRQIRRRTALLQQQHARIRSRNCGSSAAARRSSSTTWRCDGWYGDSAGPVRATRSRTCAAERHGKSPLYSTTGSTGGSSSPPPPNEPSRSSSRYSIAVYSNTRSAMLGSSLDWNSSSTSTCSQRPCADSAFRRHTASPRRCR